MDKKLDWTHPEPLWKRTADLPSFEKLTEPQDTEVAVIGGESRVLQLHFCLQRKGKKLLLLRPVVY